MMWEVDGFELTVPGLIDPTPVRELYYFDGPLIYVCHSASGLDHLAYCCGRGKEFDRFLVVGLDESGAMERELVACERDLRGVLGRVPPHLLMDVYHHDGGVDFWLAWTLPDDVLPEAGVTLYREAHAT